jgi:hypothetical protein
MDKRSQEDNFKAMSLAVLNFADKIEELAWVFISNTDSFP